MKREMKEETNLDIKVTEFLLDEPDLATTYQRVRIYLCEPLSGDAKPGYEPEPEVASVYGIVEVKWFDLRSEENWDSKLVNDPIIYLPLQRIRGKLGYLPKTI